MVWVGFGAGLVIGGVVAWLIASSRFRTTHVLQMTEASVKAQAAERLTEDLRQEKERTHQEFVELRRAHEQEQQGRVKAETQLQEAWKNLEEQKHLLEDATRKLTDTFEALSSQALKENNQAFIKLAEQTLRIVTGEAQGDLGKRQEAIQGLIRPLQDALQRYEEQIRGMEKRHQEAYGGLEQQMKHLGLLIPQLQKETGQLANALRNPQARGRWGEMALKRVAELAGMTERCDFDLQVSMEGEEGRSRPDMVVKLPKERQIAVDAKVPTAGFDEALAATDDEGRHRALERHASLVRDHVKRLASREYWRDLPQSTDFVVMFIPGESFFSAALEVDQTLIEDAMEKRVILATPTTLVALLRAVDLGWRQEVMAQNAEQISGLAKELYERIAVFTGHLRRVGEALGQAASAYNKAVGSLEGRILPSARKFKELGVPGGEDIPETPLVEHELRVLTSTGEPE